MQRRTPLYVDSLTQYRKIRSMSAPLSVNSLNYALGDYTQPNWYLSLPNASFKWIGTKWIPGGRLEEEITKYCQPYIFRVILLDQFGRVPRVMTNDYRPGRYNIFVDISGIIIKAAKF